MSRIRLEKGTWKLLKFTDSLLFISFNFLCFLVSRVGSLAVPDYCCHLVSLGFFLVMGSILRSTLIHLSKVSVHCLHAVNQSLCGHCYWIPALCGVWKRNSAKSSFFLSSNERTRGKNIPLNSFYWALFFYYAYLCCKMSLRKSINAGQSYKSFCFVLFFYLKSI